MRGIIFLSLLAAPAALACPVQVKSNSSTSLGESIISFQLYPENADFDRKRNVAYISAAYNASVAVFDPSKKAIIDTFTFPGLTGNPLLHASGVQVDPLDRLSVTVNAGAAFDTAGQDITGDNFLVKFDLKEKRVLWQKNLTALTNGVYGGYQDIEHDNCGNSFVVGTWPSSILKVSADGVAATTWYLNPDTDHTKQGFTGLASKGNILLVSDENGGKLLRFDMRDGKGQPTVVPVGRNGNTPIGQSLDAIYLPDKYSGKILLVSNTEAGTVVLRSKDGSWDTAERLGVVANPFRQQGGSATACVQMGDRIYSLIEFFGDALNMVPGTNAGNRTEFPLHDITAAVDNLLL